VARNPRDAAVSFFHHFRHMHSYRGTMEDFIDAFLEDKVMYTPFNNHVLEYWKIAQKEPNVLFLFYEDMKVNLAQVVEKTMKFLDKNYSQDQIEKLCKHLSFESMRSNPMLNHETFINWVKSDEEHKINEDFKFMRKGQVGSGKEELSERHNQLFESYMKHPDFERFGFSYK
jgi:sulfotransferase